MINGRKMSKSEGNFFTLRDLVAKGYSPKAIRLVLISTHYRKPLDFTEEKVKQAESTVKNLELFIAKMKKVLSKNNEIPPTKLDIIENAKNKFVESMDDDLNVPEALGIVFSLISEFENTNITAISSKEAEEILRFLADVKRVLDFFDMDIDEVPQEALRMLEERENLRKNREFSKADEIRNRLTEMGYEVIDTKIGSIVVKFKK
jgi:cysteinyl-tRNA synthetase